MNNAGLVPLEEPFITNKQHQPKPKEYIKRLKHYFISEKFESVVLYSFLAAVCALSIGYDLAVFSSNLVHISEIYPMTTIEKEALVSLAQFVATIGALLSGKICDVFGRKIAMLSASVFFLGGFLLFTFSPNLAAMYVARVFTGLGIGGCYVSVPLYIAEIAPAKYRGFLVSIMEIVISLGLIIGYSACLMIIDLVEDKTAFCRWTMGLGIVGVSYSFYTISQVPESPRWLISVERADEAQMISGQLFTEEEAKSEVQEIHQLLLIQQQSTWKDIFCPTKSILRMLIVGLGINFFQQAVGIEVVGLYSPTNFHNAGLMSDKFILCAMIGTTLIRFSFTIVATFLLDRMGRKKLLTIAAAGISISLSVLGMSFIFSNIPLIAVVSQMLFMAFFSTGFGPVCWVLCSELFPLRLRGRATSLGVVVNRLVGAIMVLFFLSYTEVVTSYGGFYTLSAISLLALFFIHFVVIETKGRSLEEIEKIFINRYEKQIQLN